MEGQQFSQGLSRCSVKGGCGSRTGLAWRQDGFGGTQQLPLVPAVGLWRRWSWGLHSGVWWEGETQQAQAGTGEVFDWIKQLYS